MLRKVCSFVLLAIVSSAAACTAVFAFGAYSSDLGVMRIRVSVEPARRGETALIVHPVGEITAYTHDTPVLLNVELDRIRKDSIEQMLSNTVQYETLLKDIETQAPLVLEKFFFRLLFLAGLGGLLGALVGRRCRLTNMLAGVVIGVLFVGAVGVRTFTGYNLHKFEQPDYKGLITYAPDLIETVRKSAEKGRNLRQYVRDMANNVSSFYVAMDRYAQKDKAGLIRILHISDIHNSPLAGDFIRMLVNGLSPEIIMNTGDITDMGTGLEMGLNESLDGIKQPHFFVSGNHDSLEVTSMLTTKYKIRVLQGEMVVFHGLRILGYGDPNALKPFDNDEKPGALDALARSIRERIAGMKQPPDILMVHNPDVAKQVAGLVPLILCGHNHKISMREDKGSIIIISGTAGAAGVRYFETKNKPEYSAALITMRRSDSKPFVEYVDMIQMNQGTGEFKIQRRFFQNSGK